VAKKADDKSEKVEAKDAKASERENLEATRKQAHDDLDAQLDRQEAMAAVPQKVIDPNESAAMETITGQAPIRDMSDAPPPGQLGPHEESEQSTPAEDVNTTPEPKNEDDGE
jgi:hypothetical protein